MHRAALALFVIAGTTATCTRPASAQCVLQWQPGDPAPSAQGDIQATTTWDPDGSGPNPALLIAGGAFTVGSMLSTSLAAFDGATWSPLGTPPFTVVTALATWNGQLVAAGGNASQLSIATWNGVAWSVLGQTNGPVNTMVVFGGNLVVGGAFASISGTPANSIAQWNGTAWSALGSGITGEVRALAVLGSLWAGGVFAQAGGLAVGNLAAWNGTAWSGAAAFNGPVRTLAARPGLTAASTFLFAGGDFTAVGATPAMHVAQLTQSTNAWSALAGLPGTACRVLRVRNTSSLLFQLHAAIDDASSDLVWRWNGTAWSSLGPILGVNPARPTAIEFWNGQYAVGLATTNSLFRLDRAVQLHDGAAWQAASGPGLDGGVYAITPLGGDIVIGGDFSRFSGTSLNRIARGGPGAWQPLGSGIGGFGVFAVCGIGTGDLVAGGLFNTAGGAAANNIARWNGSSWAPLGAGTNGAVYALQALPNGELIAAGSFTMAGGSPANRIARWNGLAWAPLGTGTDLPVNALCLMGNGELAVGGLFATAGGVPTARGIARWNGSSWNSFATGVLGTVNALASLPNGDLVAGGSFATAGGLPSPNVALWDGGSWRIQSAPGMPMTVAVTALAALPNGAYIGAGVACSLCSNGAQFARHDGGAASTSWSPLGVVGTVVAATVLLPNGDLLLGGTFDGGGGVVSHGFARLRPTCPAAAVPHGNGCAGSGGNQILGATALPWIGSTCRGRAVGLPPIAIALGITGFAPLAVPMPQLLPQGVAGCSLLVTPDLIDASLASSGTASTAIALPNTTALAGQLLYQQVAALELDLAGNIVALTSTNGLTLTIGVL